jgi:hypothetical protein
MPDGDDGEALERRQLGGGGVGDADNFRRPELDAERAAINGELLPVGNFFDAVTAAPAEARDRVKAPMINVKDRCFLIKVRFRFQFRQYDLISFNLQFFSRFSSGSKNTTLTAAAQTPARRQRASGIISPSGAVCWHPLPSGAYPRWGIRPKDGCQSGWTGTDRGLESPIPRYQPQV